MVNLKIFWFKKFWYYLKEGEGEKRRREEEEEEEEKVGCCYKYILKFILNVIRDYISLLIYMIIYRIELIIRGNLGMSIYYYFMELEIII